MERWAIGPFCCFLWTGAVRVVLPRHAGGRTTRKTQRRAFETEILAALSHFLLRRVRFQHRIGQKKAIEGRRRSLWPKARKNSS